MFSQEPSGEPFLQKLASEILVSVRLGLQARKYFSREHRSACVGFS